MCVWVSFSKCLFYSFVWIFSVQFGENRQVLQALRTLLEEFREELQEEETRRCQLQQSYANDKAAWEVKWAEMKCQVAQVQMASQRPTLKRQDTIWCRKLVVHSISSKATVNMLPFPRMKSHSGQTGNKSKTTNVSNSLPLILATSLGPIIVVLNVQ